MVRILDVFYSDEKIFTVYKFMEVSLHQIRSISSLNAYKIASISKEVQGLNQTYGISNIKVGCRWAKVCPL